MSRPTLSSYIRDNLEDLSKKKEPGPYVTVSRQFGCDGYGLGDLLLEKLNERAVEGASWNIFKKGILKELAESTGLTAEVIEKERLAKPSLLKDLLRGVRKNNIPDGYEIRNKITIMVRTVAFEGHAIIIGQGGTAATADLSNGLSVRLEAPKEWRIAKVSRRENLNRQEAILKIEDIEKRRKHLRKIYEQQNTREPAFNLVIDNAAFCKEDIVEMIIFAMEKRNLIASVTEGNI